LYQEHHDRRNAQNDTGFYAAKATIFTVVGKYRKPCRGAAEDKKIQYPYFIGFAEFHAGISA
jgi:hypothetical protein